METLSHHDLAVLLVLLAAGAGLLALVPVVRVPYPILLVLGGLGLGFVPGLPEVRLPPELVLVGVLPVLLYSAAFFTPLRELRSAIRPVGFLAIGLVAATAATVATVAHALVPAIPWSAAFALGAIVGPTDPLAATAIMQRLGAPRRVVSIVEGESLVNDGTALTLYAIAVGAAATGRFSLVDASGRFALNVLGGAAIGLAVGWLVRQVRLRLHHPPAEVTISILTGFFAYLPAEIAGVSAVIAAVTAGVYLGWHTSELTTAEVRILGASVWEILTFLLNALLFALVGLQLPSIVDEIRGYPWQRLLAWGAAVAATVIATRLAFVLLSLGGRVVLTRARPTPRTWAAALVVSWSGMRGAVSLAAALALPLATEAGAPFPQRSLILYLTFAVILATLVLQGLTLGPLVSRSALEDDSSAEREEALARVRVAEAALERLDELLDEQWAREDSVERLRDRYRFRRSRFAARLDDGDDGRIEEQSQLFQRLRRELLEVERATLEALRRERTIDDDVLRRVERDLDLEESRLDDR